MTLMRSIGWTRISRKGITIACLTIGLVSAIAFGVCQEVVAQDTELSKFSWRLRAGVAIPTQSVLKNIGNETTLASVLNLEGLYDLNEWLRVGFMYEWHEHAIDTWGPEFGSLSVHSLLPTVELRPPSKELDKRGLNWLAPYASMGMGVNIHTFKNAARLGNASVSFNDTFAFRIAGGVDIPLTDYFAFNTEIAWNRDDGTYTFNGVEADFNASTFNVLGGLRIRY